MLKLRLFIIASLLTGLIPVNAVANTAKALGSVGRAGTSVSAPVAITLSAPSLSQKSLSIPSLSGSLELPASIVIPTQSATKAAKAAERSVQFAEVASPVSPASRVTAKSNPIPTRTPSIAKSNQADEAPKKKEGILNGLKKRWKGYWEGRSKDKKVLDHAEFGTKISGMFDGSNREGVLVGIDRKHAVVAFEKDGAWTEKKIRRRSLSKLEAKGVDSAVPIKNAERRKTRMNRRSGFHRFTDEDHWANVVPQISGEIGKLREVADTKAYLRKVGAEIVARIQKNKGAREIGFHYNLHGGMAEGYVTSGGIRAGRGDIALQYTTNGDLAYKVYLFRSSNVNLYDILSERGPDLVSARMGSVLNIFDSKSDFILKAEADGAIPKQNEISIDFEDNWINKRGMIGIPYSTYLAPPVEPFAGRSGKRFGLKGRISKDEETLAAMRYIEAVVLGSK